MTAPKGRNAEVAWHGQKRSNDTHASTTDPEARLYRKSNNTAAQLCYAGHLLIEHRSALIVDAELTAATGYAERDCASRHVETAPRRARGDEPWPATRTTTPKNFVAEVRAAGFTPHVAQNTTNRRSAIDGTHHPPRRIRRVATDPQTGRGTLRLGQDRRARSQVALHRPTTATGPGSR